MHKSLGSLLRCIYLHIRQIFDAEVVGYMR
jgi:hypothetical protein